MRGFRLIGSVVQAGCVRFAFSRASTSSAVDFRRGPKPCSASFSAVASGAAGGIEFDQRLVGGRGLDLAFAQALQRVLRFRQRGFVRPCRFHAAAAHGAHRFRGAGDAAAAIEFGETASAPATWRFSRAISWANRVRAVIAASRSASRPAIDCAASRARSSRPPSSAAVARTSRSAMPRVGGVEPAAFLLVLRDRQRQRPLAALDGRGRIAHLLVEDQQRRAIFQFLPGGGDAAAEECQNGFEHWPTPCVMSIAHELVIAYLEHCSRTILSNAQKNGESMSKTLERREKLREALIAAAEKASRPRDWPA